MRTLHEVASEIPELALKAAYAILTTASCDTAHPGFKMLDNGSMQYNRWSGGTRTIDQYDIGEWAREYRPSNLTLEEIKKHFS